MAMTTNNSISVKPPVLCLPGSSSWHRVLRVLVLRFAFGMAGQFNHIIAASFGRFLANGRWYGHTARLALVGTLSIEALRIFY
jgi:hypothetical protein